MHIAASLAECGNIHQQVAVTESVENRVSPRLVRHDVQSGVVVVIDNHLQHDAALM